MSYYEVEAKCGHVGVNFYTLKNFYVKATNGKEAASKVRNMPRVKHNHKDAIRSVKCIDLVDYILGSLSNMLDPYFTCKNIQEQRKLCSNCDLQIYEEIKKSNYKKSHERRRLVDEARAKESPESDND